MLRLIRFLKPYTFMIFVIFILLYAQALTDLSLPDYMSSIVNVGIQQKGVSDAVPEALRATEYDNLLLLMPASDATTVKGEYRVLKDGELTEVDRTKFEKLYPVLATEAVAVYTPSGDVTRAELDAILVRAIALRQVFEKGLSNFPGFSSADIPAQVANLKMADIAKLPEAMRIPLIQGIHDAMDKMTVSASTLQQIDAGWITTEYQAVGVDQAAIQTNYVLGKGGMMLLIALLGALCTIIVGYLAARVASGVGRDLRSRIFRTVEGFANEEFDKFSTASLITRSTNDIQQIQMMLVMLLRILFYAPIMAIGGLIKIIGGDASMTWIIGAAVGALLTVMLVVFTVAIPKFKAMQKLVDRLNLVSREILSGLMVIRAFNTRRIEEKKFDGANVDLTKTMLFVNRVMVLMMPIMMLIMNGTMLAILWFGAKQIDAGNMQIGNMMAFIQYAMQIIFSFLMVSMVFFMVPRASVAATRIGEVFDMKATILDPKEPKPFVPGACGLVEFQDVGFRYPKADDNVLCGISFTAEPGKTTAIVGSTGSGKSTLVNLLLRFYDVSEGRILVDGTDIRDVRQKDLRSRIGYVPQKGTLFSGDVRSNVAYGNPEATDEDVTQALRVAQATEFVEANEAGTAMAVSQDGTNVSGGQRQRLSIARALAVHPEIFIFDDSFSALDFKTDAALRKALHEETADATVLIVAQRIGTVLSADRILVLDEGSIVGIGTHKELMESCSVYREIALSQLSAEELAR